MAADYDDPYYDPYIPTRAQELMLRVAQRPSFCCCCIYIPREDRKRARRIFRLTRAVMREWEKEQERLTDDGLSRNA